MSPLARASMRAANAVSGSQRRQVGRNMTTNIQHNGYSTSYRGPIGSYPGPNTAGWVANYQKGGEVGGLKHGMKLNGGSLFVPACAAIGCGLGFVIHSQGNHVQPHPTLEQKENFARKHSWGATTNTHLVSVHTAPAWKRDTVNSMGVVPNQMAYGQSV